MCEITLESFLDNLPSDTFEVYYLDSNNRLIDVSKIDLETFDNITAFTSNNYTIWSKNMDKQLRIVNIIIKEKIGG